MQVPPFEVPDCTEVCELVGAPTSVHMHTADTAEKMDGTTVLFISLAVAIVVVWALWKLVRI